MITVLAVLTLLAIAGAALGAWLGTAQGSRAELWIRIGTGALLGITVFDILPESQRMLPGQGFISALLAGFVLLQIASRYLGPACPACSTGSGRHIPPLRDIRGLLPVLVAIAFHCSLDGLIVAMGAHQSHSQAAGLVFGVGLHKLPEGLALGLLLAGSGASRAQILGLAAGVEAMTAVGGAIGVAFLPSLDPVALGSVYAIVGGGFLFLVVNSVREGLQHTSNSVRVRTLAIEALGFAGTGTFFWVIGRMFAS